MDDYIMRKYSLNEQSWNGIIEASNKCECEKSIVDSLPSSQIGKRKKMNDTYCHRVPRLLHEDFYVNADHLPDNMALQWVEPEYGEMTYGELREHVLTAAGLLKKVGVSENDNVAVTMEKGHKQIIAILSVLSVGACYVPVGIKQPENRRNKIFESANVNYLITDFYNTDNLNIDRRIKVVNIDSANPCEKMSNYVEISPNSRAYIIFTSGTSGEPKGVSISHQGCRNTIEDVIDKFKISSKDKGISISELDFDLSVFDIFGMLTAGGSLFLIDETKKKEAAVWSEYVEDYGITVWNSVPAIFEMLLLAKNKETVLKPLRMALLSGDWVRPRLFNILRDSNKECRFIALGGATEASIWSNYYEVTDLKEEWTSIPYGMPLSNQFFKIVDSQGRDCPDYVPGEIYIGGRGVADGYINRADLTDEKFVTVDKIRWYRTGDMGMYTKDAIIEFLGRMDNQVKIRGFRIELEEISKNLEKHPDIARAVTVKVDENVKQYLGAVVVEKTPLVIGKNFWEKPNRAGRDRKNEYEAVESQNKIVSWYINLVLNITLLLEEKEEIPLQTIYEKCSVVECMKSVVILWIGFLEKLEYVQVNNKILLKGKKYLDLAHQKMPSEARPLCDKVGLYRQMLNGEKSTLELLNDDLLSPEKMASNEEGIIKGIDSIADRVKDIQEHSKKEKALQIAVLGVRSGLTVKKLVTKLMDISGKWVFFDHASSMVEHAKDRLEELGVTNQFVIMPEYYVDNEWRHTFDVVISLNYLHTYMDLNRGLFMITSLLKCTGRVFSLELSELPPMALLNGALLEEGYLKYNKSNRPTIGNPMLTGKEWCEKFHRSGFKSINLDAVGETLYELVEAKEVPEGAVLKAETIKEFLIKNLPEYMIPEKIIFLYELPLNKNDKVDIKTITELFKNEEKVDCNIPKTRTELQVEEIWKNILHLKSIGQNQSFFKMGGDSLLATHFISLIKDMYSVEISMKEIFELPTLSEVAANIDTKRNNQADEEVEYGEI